MIAVFSLLIIIILSIIVIRIGAVALELTGLDHEVAAFQAQSAFSGAGFTTEESETIVNNPLRRKIIRILILLGSAGVSSSIATLILTFVNKSNTDILHRGLVLLLGLIAIFLFTRSSFIYKIMKNIIKNILIRKTSFPVYDYQHILGLAKGFSISKIKVKGNSWLKDKKLKELKLNLEGAMILSLYRYINGEEKFIAIPNGDTEIKKGDTLICYSKANISKALSRRAKGRKGQNEHEKHKGNEKKMAQIRQKTGGYEM